MTVLTKPSITVKKIPLIDENHCDEAVIEMQPTDPSKRQSRSGGAILCMSFTVFLLVLMGVITALQIYDQATTDVLQHNHYQGVCTIPLSDDLHLFKSRKLELRWKTKPHPALMLPEVEVVSVLDEDPEPMPYLLYEALDIDIDDSIEKISVYNNGHPVSFIHDFESNFTGIVDAERCFTMELDPEVVLQPELLLQALQHGALELSRVRRALRAALPALRAPPAALARCAPRPTYRLLRDAGPLVRKRSVDAPPHEYMHFAGKHIQEIDISNLAELLQYEQDNKQASSV